MPVLNEKTSGIVSLLDDVCIGSMSHMPLSSKLGASRNHLNLVAVFNLRTANDNDAFSNLQTLGDADHVAERVSNFNDSLVSETFSTLVLNHKYRKSVGVFAGTDNRA